MFNTRKRFQSGQFDVGIPHCRTPTVRTKIKNIWQTCLSFHKSTLIQTCKQEVLVWLDDLCGPQRFVWLYSESNTTKSWFNSDLTKKLWLVTQQLWLGHIIGQHCWLTYFKQYLWLQVVFYTTTLTITTYRFILAINFYQSYFLGCGRIIFFE